jgi:hypothetical protein
VVAIRKQLSLEENNVSGGLVWSSRVRTILCHMRSSPVSRKRRCSQKLLVGVLFVHVLLFEIHCGHLFNEYPGSGQKLGFCVVGVEDESVVLRRGK